jgi:alanine dehydrogenase
MISESDLFTRPEARVSANSPTDKAAFEITKGTRHVLTLSEAEVARVLDPRELVDALEEGFRGLEAGDVQCPPRTMLSVPGKGFSLAMPAWRPGLQIAVKIVNVFDGNLSLDLPSHLALINLFDPETGLTTGVMDGTLVTAMRTAATAVLSVRMLSKRDSRVATVVGAGVQGREHLRVLPLVRELHRIHVCSLRLQDAERLSEQSRIARATADLEAAVRGSDIVCLATSSPDPVIDASWIQPGTHVTSVGYHPPGGELPRELVRNSRLFVETLDAFQAPPVGCGELAGLDASAGTSLGSVALGRKPGRTSDREVTVYKGMGIAMEDMVAANLAYQRARRDGGAGTMLW